MNISSEAFVLGCSAIGAGLALIARYRTWCWTGIRSRTGAAAVGRNPGAKGDITSTMLLGQAVAETTGLYGLVIGLILYMQIHCLQNFNKTSRREAKAWTEEYLD